MSDRQPRSAPDNEPRPIARAHATRESGEYLAQLNTHLSHLCAFARQMNELDFAASLGGEFRGSQDAGWATTITAYEVFEEFNALANRREPLSKAEYRVLLMLYCQLWLERYDPHLATTAKDIGLSRLASLLELAFRDHIRNGMYHADYVIWNDGLRLRKRNGGVALYFRWFGSTRSRAGRVDARETGPSTPVSRTGRIG